MSERLGLWFTSVFHEDALVFALRPPLELSFVNHLTFFTFIESVARTFMF